MMKAAIVGCGRISKRHIEALKDTSGINIEIVCDIDAHRAKETAGALNCKWTEDYRTIQGMDVISVLTPSGLHPLHAAEIAESCDAPNIVVEKPVSLTLREAYELFSRVDRAGKRLIPVYQNRYNPLVQLIKGLLEEKKLGKIHQFICNVLWNRNDEYFSIDWHGTRALDGGVLYTQASHYVDMLHYFFGDLVESKGLGGNLRGLEVNDSVSALMKFQSGVIGTLNATVDAYPRNYSTEFTLIAEKGLIRLSGTNLNEIVHWAVEGMDKPDMDFKLDHQYGKGHNSLYEHLVDGNWNQFPSREDVLSGIGMMERLSY